MSGTNLDSQVAEYAKYSDLPTKNQTVGAGRYKVKELSEVNVGATGPEIASKLWFRSPVGRQSNTGVSDQNTDCYSL